MISFKTKIGQIGVHWMSRLFGYCPQIELSGISITLFGCWILADFPLKIGSRMA